jgi:hypothetical protein
VQLTTTTHDVHERPIDATRNSCANCSSLCKSAPQHFSEIQTGERGASSAGDDHRLSPKREDRFSWWLTLRTPHLRTRESTGGSLLPDAGSLTHCACVVLHPILRIDHSRDRAANGSQQSSSSFRPAGLITDGTLRATVRGATMKHSPWKHFPVARRSCVESRQSCRLDSSRMPSTSDGRQC